jgi:hypothetical protein
VVVIIGLYMVAVADLLWNQWSLTWRTHTPGRLVIINCLYNSMTRTSFNVNIVVHFPQYPLKSVEYSNGKGNKYLCRVALIKVSKVLLSKMNKLVNCQLTIIINVFILLVIILIFKVSLLAATLYQGNPDRNHKLWNIVSNEIYILHMEVLLECFYI